MDMASIQRYFFDQGAKAQRGIVDRQPAPVVIVNILGGAVESTRSNAAVRLIVLDGDIEGTEIEADRLGDIEGGLVCLSDHQLDGADPIEQVVKEVDQHWIDVGVSSSPIVQPDLLGAA